MNQARHQDSVTGGAEINFGRHEKFILCELERGTGAREIYPTLVQMNKVRRKNLKGYFGRNRNFTRFFRPKTGDLQKKRKRSSMKFQGIFRPKSEFQAVFPAENR